MLSERTLTKLQGIRKCSINGHKAKDLFQFILNAPDLWEQAYGNIHANKGAMTPGVDGLTMDGYSNERAANVRELLRENRYVPPPVKRAYIPKPNGKQRPLGKPTAGDKQVQEVWRMVLESIYERAGCEYSRVHTLRTLVIVEAKSGNRVWGRQQYTRHAAAACRRECA